MISIVCSSSTLSSSVGLFKCLSCIDDKSFTENRIEMSRILTKEQITQILFEDAEGSQDLSEIFSDFFDIVKGFFIMLSIGEDSCDL